jgi:hypothetical protein
MNDVNPDILDEFLRLTRQNLLPSQVMRQVFLKFGEISPPVMAQYFNAAYSLPAIDFMAALGAWWHDNSSDISDNEFDRRVRKVLAQSV